MGVWTWLHRTRPEIEPGDETSTEIIHTGRAWHALHVGLVEPGAELPARHVLGCPFGHDELCWNDIELTHEPAAVRALSAFLDGVDVEAVVARVELAIEGGDLYSPWSWTIEDIRKLFAEVQRFYRAAATAGEAVHVHRRRAVTCPPASGRARLS